MSRDEMPANDGNLVSLTTGTVKMSPSELSIVFFLQAAVILTTGRGLGLIARRCGQPQVIAEMIAGILLGPSVFRLLFPGLQQQLFPEESKQILYCFSQLGLSLYMFLVGMEFRTDLFRTRARSAAAVSVAGMVVPFLLGAGLAAWLAGRTGFFGVQVGRMEAMLYLGASMCITAFPMLARIIVERGLSGTTLGTLALAAGAIDDAAAWCLLAIVLASFDADASIAVWAIGGGVSYGLVVLTVARWLLRPLGQRVSRAGSVSPEQFSVVLTVFMLAAWLTDVIGIHSVFGAFMLGCAMPRGLATAEITRQMEPLTTALLLPLFFAYSGLNTRLDLITTSDQWMVCGVVLLAACLGKGGACWAAARLTGTDQPTALALGTLMNARGLMELIILNIGLQRGLITPELFSIMVVMAIVTTLMASPLFELVYGRRARAAGTLGASGTA